MPASVPLRPSSPDRSALPASADPNAAPVGIVGAGVAGLATALALSRAGIATDVVEKSRGPGGRTATRRRPDGAAYDFGATSFPLDDSDDDVRRVLLGIPDLPDALVRVDGDIWVSERGGPPQAGAPERQHPRWTLQGGMNRLGHRLLAASGARLVARTRVVRVGSTPGGWALVCEDGQILGPYRALVLTPPAPQTAELLDIPGEEATREAKAGTATSGEGASPWAAARVLREALHRVPYAPQFALSVGLSTPCPRPDGACAVLVRGGPLAWVSFEETKAGHIPTGEDGTAQGLIVAQATPEWSAAHLDDAPDAVTGALLSALAEVLGPLPAVAWADLHRWRYARPLAPLDVPEAAHFAGLFIASDADGGVAGVPEALRSGLRAADDVRRHIGAEARLRATSGPGRI